MRTIVLAAAAAAVAGVSPGSRAQGGVDPHQAPRPAAAAPVAPAAPVSPAGPASPEAARTPASDRSAPEPRAAWHIAEDDHVRIEELRVRGESRHITVQPKLPGARPYEILPASGAQDPSQRGRRPPGQSQWRVLSF